MSRRVVTGDAGFTLVEVLVAISLLTIAVVGVGSALVFQAGGMASGASLGLAAINRGHYIATATMLAAERIEQMKNVSYASITSTSFPSEAYGAIAGYPNYRRTVTIQTDVPAAGMTTVTVQTIFRPLTEAGTAPEQTVQLATIIASR